MKKILSLVSAIALALPLFAGTVTFKPSDFANQGASGSGGAVSATKGGVTVACDKGYGSGTALRCYKNGVLTITSETNISTIDFSFETDKGTEYNGSLDAQVTVNATSWTNTMASQGRFTEIVVTIAGEGVIEEPVDTFTVSQTLARLAEGKTGECYVKGKVISIITNNVETYGNISYWMADTENPTDSLQAFRMKATGNAAYASAADVEFVEGDEVLVYAAGLAMYHNNNTNQDIPELNTGYFVRKLAGADLITLDYPYGEANREEGKWEVLIAASNVATADHVSFVFASNEEAGIAGYHSIDLAESKVKINGVETAVTAGYIKLTFKSVSTDDYNVYAVEAKAVCGDVAYRVLREIEIAAFDDAGDEVALSADRPFTPTVDEQEVTCAQAREYALSLASGAESELKVTVTGYVTDLFTDGTQFWMDDAAGSKQTILVFKFSSLAPAGKSLANGAKVKVVAKVSNYNGKPELVKAAVEILEGGTTLETHPVTVAEAVAATQALAQGATSTDLYEITGFISSVVEAYSEQYKNVTFWMSDDLDSNDQVFQAYHISCEAAIADKLVEGARVRVTAHLKHFHQDATEATEGQDPKPERTVFEAVNGEVILLAGAGVEDTNIQAPAVKFIENGRIIIMRNGVRYDVQGRIAE